MASQIRFSWGSNQGLGLLASLIGWSLLFQIIPVFHVFTILNLGNTFNEQIIIVFVVILTTVTLTALTASILENLSTEDEMYSQGLIKVTFILFIVMITYEIGYLLAIPIMDFLSPFLGIEFIAGLEGLNAYISSLVISLVFPGLIWGISETIISSKEP